MSTDHKSLNQIIDHRIEKLNKIIEGGKNPYPHSFDKKNEISFCSSQKLGDIVQTAGRIVSLRKMGKAAFLNIQDESGKIQIYIKSSLLPDNIYDIVGRNIDLGDIVGVKGEIFITKTGEISIRASEFFMLSKNIRPLPNLKEKDGITFYSFEDKELRYRHRQLDLIANPNVISTFRLRSKIISTIRNFLDENGFLEVDTPVLQPVYGGANARPFKTFHNTLDQSLYMRIAVELYLKRLIIGGIEKVYELGKNFRNEGMDRNHNPEFTMLEIYEAYKDVYHTANFTENLIKTVAKKVDKTQVEFSGHKINFVPDFKKTTMAKELKNVTGEDVLDMDEKQLKELAKSKGIEVNPKMNYGKILDELFSKLVEPSLIKPTFVFDYPKAISPLAKSKRDGDENIVERFELFIGGMEFANAFSELNNPIEQRKRLENQAKLRDLGDEEAQVVDENFLKAMEAGMPPTGGVGIGIDRLIMLFSGENSIKDVLFFPAMRPE
ncbi:MAG: lysine--tRNA ligase [Candidatus Marinimicrobia bacterium]|nr:lysine--tRNA ligase [Candidatus Neomarinimicrobiota bacterium]